MEHQHPKAGREGYGPLPFFFDQTNDSGHVRTIAWAGSVQIQRMVLESLINELPGRVEVLLKVKRLEDSGTEAPDVWRRHHGIVDRAELLSAMVRRESFVYRDCRNQLCVRDPETREYLVLDHVGVIYIYSDDTRFRDVLLRYGFEGRVETLITEGGYWGQEPADAAAAGVEFRRLLRLTPVAGPQSRPDSTALE